MTFCVAAATLLRNVFAACAKGCPMPTNRGDRWVFALDHAGAQDWSHCAIAEHIQSVYKIPDWWRRP